MLLLFVGKNGKSFCERLIDYKYVGLSFDTIAKTKAWIKGANGNEELPCVIISDLQLPDGNAFELCKHAQGKDGLTNLIFMVVARNFVQADKERAAELGIDAYFSYPPMGREIDQRIKAIQQIRQKTLLHSTHSQGANNFLTVIRNLLAPH